MNTQAVPPRARLGRGLLLVLALAGLVGAPSFVRPARAQSRSISITADQPNVWTLEQAHYLLAQMHRRNLDLRAKNLEDLDPNAINGLRFDVLKTLLEIGVAYDDATRLSNRLVAQNQTYNAERRRALQMRNDALREESLNLTRTIARLESEQARATTQDAKDQLASETAEKKAVLAAVDKEIEHTNGELKNLTAPSGELKSTAPEVAFNPEKLPAGLFDESLKETAKKLIEGFNQEPKLNASLMLDNYLQMQYEIIAKQLTLLRDEVGPGERLLFLELPQSVNVTHGRANKKWAQSWWRIAGYTRYADDAQGEQETSRAPAPVSDTYGVLFKGSGYTRGGRTPKPVVFESLGADSVAGADELSDYSDILSNREVRTIDLIPRQSSLNVNDLKLRTRSGAFSIVASFLFGLGARANYQRQREQYSQFVQQELYSSAFGKGAREFGWTFTPMPGTDRLLPGVRTTYAVVVVPKKATSVVLESTGCYFPRDARQPNDFDATAAAFWTTRNVGSYACGPRRAFVVPIPRGGDDKDKNAFDVTEIAYKHVKPGQRIVVSVSGESFPSQLGVLVNGVSLVQSIGIAQPLILDDSRTRTRVAAAAPGGVQGEFERVSDEQIIFWFNMPPDFAGTPVITLVAPGQAMELNYASAPVVVDGQAPAASLEDADAMFQKDPAPTPAAFRIDNVEVFRAAPGRLTAVIEGAGFASGQVVLINGQRLTPGSPESPTLARVAFPTPTDDTIRVTIVNGTETAKAKPVANPGRLRVGDVKEVSFEPARGRLPAVLVVRIEGAGFTDDLVSSIGQLVVQSATEALLKIENPNAAAVVRLYDPVTRQSVRTIITRKQVQE